MTRLELFDQTLRMRTLLKVVQDALNPQLFKMLDHFMRDVFEFIVEEEKMDDDEIRTRVNLILDQLSNEINEAKLNES